MEKITPRPSPGISPSASTSASPARPGKYQKLKTVKTSKKPLKLLFLFTGMKGSFKKQDSYNRAIEKGYDMLHALDRINNYEEVLRDLKEKNRYVIH